MLLLLSLIISVLSHGCFPTEPEGLKSFKPCEICKLDGLCLTYELTWDEKGDMFVPEFYLCYDKYWYIDLRPLNDTTQCILCGDDGNLYYREILHDDLSLKQLKPSLSQFVPSHILD